jgi:hypothetical protein
MSSRRRQGLARSGVERTAALVMTATIFADEIDGWYWRLSGENR